VLDNFKIPGISASDASRLFRVFDHNNDGEISFDEFLTTLCGDFPANRRRLVKEAFEKLDADKSGTLEMREVKEAFDPTRHPDVKAGLKTVEEVRFGFFEMFTQFHNASTGFTGESSISMHEFLEYHQYLNEQFERDGEFRNFIIGVWNLDVQQIGKAEYAGKHPDQYGKNSREQWKMENHKVLFGKPTVI
jgi:calcyphosin